MFCNERGCDCRRVFFYVVASFREGPEAFIAWGWDSPEFYTNWLRDDDPIMIAQLIGPSLNLGRPQTELADGLLNLLRDVLLQTRRMLSGSNDTTHISGQELTASQRHRPGKTRRSTKTEKHNIEVGRIVKSASCASLSNG